MRGHNCWSYDGARLKQIARPEISGMSGDWKGRMTPVQTFPGSADSNRQLRLTFRIFIAAGLLFTLVNRSWPIARNAIFYAKAALGVIHYHFNLLALGHDRTWTSGKPILFSIFAAPFVWLFNADTGIVIASAVATTFFLWMVTLALPRLNKHCGLSPSLMPLEFVLVAFNPLVFSQFWSGYADALFAGLVLLAFILTDIVADEPERDSRGYILGLGATIYFAIHTKLYGAVLGFICPVYLLMHGRQFVTRSSHRGSKIVILALVFAALAVVLIAAKLGINPLLDFNNGAGYDDFIGGLVDSKSRDVIGSLLMLAFAALLNFHAALFFLATRAAWRVLAPAPTVYVAIYLLGLLTFPGTSFNMRFFLPAFPLLALAVAAGAQSIGPTARRAILGAYGAIALVLVLSFNFAPVEQALEPVVSRVFTRHWLVPLWLDNLRLPVQISIKKQIDAINAQVPQGSTIYWSSDYYDTATHGMAEYLGVKKNLDIRYVLYSPQVPVSAEPVFLTEFTAGRPPDAIRQPPEWATVQAVGYGLFRLDPISAKLVSVPGDYVAQASTIRLQANITAGERLKVSTVEFLEGETSLGTDREPPFDLDLRDPRPGRHQIAARVRYGDRGTLISVSDPIVVYVGIPALERTASEIADLAVELPDGSVGSARYALDMGANKSIFGIHFDDIGVPQGAHIAKAYLEFRADSRQSRPSVLRIQAERSVNAAALKFENGDLSRRPRTTANVLWDPSPWTAIGQQERSPNLAPILEAIFAQTSWQPGNAVTLLINGSSGRRAAQVPAEHGRDAAPVLYIELQQ
jgi:hypothetical protein